MKADSRLCLSQACNLDPKSDKEYSFEKLFEEAQEQLDDIKEHPINGEVDPGFVRLVLSRSFGRRS